MHKSVCFDEEGNINWWKRKDKNEMEEEKEKKNERREKEGMSKRKKEKEREEKQKLFFQYYSNVVWLLISFDCIL